MPIPLPHSSYNFARKIYAADAASRLKHSGEETTQGERNRKNCCATVPTGNEYCHEPPALAGLVVTIIQLTRFSNSLPICHFQTRASAGSSFIGWS